MLAPNVGQIASLVGAMLEGGLEKVLEDKLEGLGEEYLMKYLAGPFDGAGQRISQAIKTGGASEIERLGQDWLNAAMPRPLPGSAFLNKMQNALVVSGQQPSRRRIHGAHGAGSEAWSRTDWASSRDDWLGNRWRHDWRSQPRDEHGRWVPGRLDYIAIALQYQGTRKGRSKRRKLRLRRLARTRGRRAAKKLFKELKRNAR
jgi:hypothetical protein